LLGLAETLLDLLLLAARAAIMFIKTKHLLAAKNTDSNLQ
jgi:hypothetical protein